MNTGREASREAVERAMPPQGKAANLECGTARPSLEEVRPKNLDSVSRISYRRNSEYAIVDHPRT